MEQGGVRGVGEHRLLSEDERQFSPGVRVHGVSTSLGGRASPRQRGGIWTAFPAFGVRPQRSPPGRPRAGGSSSPPGTGAGPAPAPVDAGQAGPGHARGHTGDAGSGPWPVAVPWAASPIRDALAAVAGVGVVLEGPKLDGERTGPCLRGGEQIVRGHGGSGGCGGCVASHRLFVTRARARAHATREWKLTHQTPQTHHPRAARPGRHRGHGVS